MSLHHLFNRKVNGPCHPLDQLFTFDYRPETVVKSQRCFSKAKDSLITYFMHRLAVFLKRKDSSLESIIPLKRPALLMELPQRAIFGHGDILSSMQHQLHGRAVLTAVEDVLLEDFFGQFVIADQDARLVSDE